MALSGTLTACSTMLMAGQRAACWAVVTNNGRYGYVTTAGTGNISGFAIAQDVFANFSGWLSDVRANFKRRIGGKSTSVVDEAERLAELRRRREALTQLLGLNSAGLSDLLMEPNSDSTSRLALTEAQRDSLVATLRTISAGSTADPPAIANIMIKWLSDKWATR